MDRNGLGLRGKQLKSLVLQDSWNGKVNLLFVAALEDNGDFTLNGEARGPADDDGDRDTYYWTVTVRKENIPALAELLERKEDEDVIDTVTRRWLEVQGQGLEELIRNSDVPSELETWGPFVF
jgi:hypothetical protein